MRKLELIAAFAILAAAVPAMAQGRGHERGHDRDGRRGVGNDGVPPGQIIARQHRRDDRDRDDNDAQDGQRGYNPNGGYNIPNGAVVLPNGQVIYPNGTRYPNGSVYYPNRNSYPNGQQCTQVADRNGNVRTMCRNDRRGDGDADDRFETGRRNRANGMRFKRGRKHRDRDDGDR